MVQYLLNTIDAIHRCHCLLCRICEKGASFKIGGPTIHAIGALPICVQAHGYVALAASESLNEANVQCTSDSNGIFLLLPLFNL